MPTKNPPPQPQTRRSVIEPPVPPKPRPYVLVQAHEIVVGDQIVSSLPSGLFEVAAIETRQIPHTPSANNELYFLLASGDGTLASGDSTPVGSVQADTSTWVWRKSRSL